MDLSYCFSCLFEPLLTQATVGQPISHQHPSLPQLLKKLWNYLGDVLISSLLPVQLCPTVVNQDAIVFIFFCNQLLINEEKG